MIGGTSVVSCNVNAEFYKAQSVVALPGAGTTPRCFNSPNISPLNAGLIALKAMQFQFAAEHLSPKKLCLIGNAHPSIPGNFKEAVERFERSSSVKVHVLNDELRTNSDHEGPLRQLLEAKCDVAVVGTLVDFTRRIAIALDKSGNRNLKLVIAPEAYTKEFAASMPSTLDGRLFAITDNTDFLDSNAAGMKRIRERLERAGMEVSPFSVEGTLAAEIFIAVVKKIRGPITRKSVLNAFLHMKPYDTQGLTPTSYKFSRPDGTRSTPGIHVVVLKDGLASRRREMDDPEVSRRVPARCLHANPNISLS